NLEAGRGGRVAIRTAAREGWTYEQVADEANRWGGALGELGVEIENRVLLCMLDGPEFAAVFWGTIKAGAVPVPVNTNLTADDYAYLLHDSRARVAVVSGGLADVLRAARDRAPFRRHLVVVGEAGGGERSYSELVRATLPLERPADTLPDDMCFWLYSSGTTGRPKGVVHLQHDLRVCTELYAKPVLGIEAADTTFSVAKLYFAYGLGNGLYFPFAVGATAVLLEEPPAPPTVLELVTRLQPTLYFGVPTSYAAILAAPESLWDAADFGSVRACVSAGEPLSGSLLHRWKERTGTWILDGIGSTEICHIFISNRLDDVRPDSSGRVVEGYEARIVDDEGSPVPDGEVGNLLVKGDSTCAFYWNQHERTKRTIQGEWIVTGDKYVRDPDGYFAYQGRADDMLKVGGIWVSPTEVEGTINGHDQVLECAVVGLPDEQQLVQTIAYVVLRDGTPADATTEPALRSFVRERLAHYKCPREFRFVESLPKTATGKIQRFKLRSG
ncbi:MAG: benzoate-CoA ligase family protein, partial [bacterium]|nr:benzoate-CoA ligase family protein [bacterium]